MDLEGERIASLLDRRTTALATRAARGPRPQGPTRPLILWSLGESLFGTDVGAVAAITPFAGCARVPTAEPACLGVIGRGGRFYSVIGMRRLLGVAAGDDQPGHLLLLRSPAPYLAMAVDRVWGRFDLEAPSDRPSGPALSFEGRLVALFTPTELRARLRPALPQASPLESMPP